jgi:hypothetical protein
METKEDKVCKRHGARNQNRHKVFVRWLLQRFDHILFHDINPRGDNDNVYILEVAGGGKGELATRLSICHKVKVLIVDPRQADISKCFEEVVLKSLPKKWQQNYLQQSISNPKFLEETIDRFVLDQQLRYFDASSVNQCTILEEAVKNASLLIGFHADGATEDIVNVALRYNKPFVVVPCCVFPNFFPNRFLVSHSFEEKVPVRSYEQFCTYLHEKDSRFIMETLPFQGRNVAIWWAGPSC